MAETWAQALPPAREVEAPLGWTRAEQFDPFEAYLGPFFERRTDGHREYALLLDERHMNAANVAHGGALMTFADAVLGYGVWDATERSPCVTVSQQSNFLATVTIGDLLWCRPIVVRRTREIVFARGDLMVGERTVFTASALWKVFERSSVA
ncbi:MAG: PaaI family thioesterase [Alphaproteobacteria bacterium]|nr:PaaI family thioesterase [Alphaproteobacteria bacterium]